MISSYVAYQSDELLGIYSVTKTALLGLVKVMAKALYDRKIRVNSIAPGLIRTKFASALLENEEVMKEKLNIHRVGLPEDIGNAAAFLCSEDGSYVNGETLSVTGFISPKL